MITSMIDRWYFVEGIIVPDGSKQSLFKKELLWFAKMSLNVEAKALDFQTSIYCLAFLKKKKRISIQLPRPHSLESSVDYSYTPLLDYIATSPRDDRDVYFPYDMVMNHYSACFFSAPIYG
jgi:hypothetical protein